MAGPGSPDGIFGRNAAAGSVQDGFGDAVDFQGAFDIGIAHGHGAERSESAGSGGEAERLAEMARFGEHGAIGARSGIFPLRAREDGGEEDDDGGFAEPPLAIEEASEFTGGGAAAKALETVRGGIVMVDAAREACYAGGVDVGFDGVAGSAGGRSFFGEAADAGKIEPPLNAEGEPQKRGEIAERDGSWGEIAPTAAGEEGASEFSGGRGSGKRDLRRARIFFEGGRRRNAASVAAEISQRVSGIDGSVGVFRREMEKRGGGAPGLPAFGVFSARGPWR